MASSGLHVALVGCHLPRCCGIATFTSDLADALEAEPGKGRVSVVAMNDIEGGYDYPTRVVFSIDQDRPDRYARAAEYLNESSADVIGLQHEYGIYGGEYGVYVLELVRRLKKPFVLTCHTVFRYPDPMRREILEELAIRADRVVVMSRLGAEFLARIYGAEREKIVFIPHGIHDLPFRTTVRRSRLGRDGGKVLVTFGLLHRKKGIEYMIEALPEVLDKHPGVTYAVLGATHPKVYRAEGESYRECLMERAARCGVRERVLFLPRFTDLGTLLSYLQETDIFVTPYLIREYITSGALAYAMGSGKAVVSTPYWYATEMLAEGRGRVVPMRDSAALARAVCELLEDERKLLALRKKAYLHCRGMVWPLVGESYWGLFENVAEEKRWIYTVPGIPLADRGSLGLRREWD